MEKKIKRLILSNEPKIVTRAIYFDDTEDEIRDKNKKQFMPDEDSTLTIIFDDDTSIKLDAPAGYPFDGATIPFGIGKGNMSLQIPALYHDIMCDNKALINYDRKLANQIFKACLIECGVNKYTAHFMYLVVEFWQIVFCKWKD